MLDPAQSSSSEGLFASAAAVLAIMVVAGKSYSHLEELVTDDGLVVASAPALP
jgi:hypothetical protein